MDESRGWTEFSILEEDEADHRPQTEEFLFYRAVAEGDIDAVRRNIEQNRFVDSEGVGCCPVTR